MPLTGTHPRSVDEKGRVALPKPLRDELLSGGDVVFVTAEPDGAVGIYSQKEFDARAVRLSQTTAEPADARRFMRVYYSQAEQCGVDGQGRFRVPERLLRHAGLSEEVVVLGVGDHAEIWPRAEWESALTNLQGDFDRLADESFRK